MAELGVLYPTQVRGLILRITESLEQDKGVTTQELLEELEVLLEDREEDVAQLMLMWVLNFGEDRHVVLFKQAGCYIFKRCLFTDFFEVLRSLEPIERCQELCQSFLDRAPSAYVHVEDQFFYNWVRDNLMSDRYSNDAMRILKQAVGSGDYRMRHLLDKLLDDGRIKAEIYTAAMLHIGAICVLRNETPTGMLLWARCFDASGRLDPFDEFFFNFGEQLKPFQNLESLQCRQHHEILIAAIDISKKLFVQFPSSYLKLPSNFVEKSIMLEKSGKNRLRILSSLVSGWSHMDIYDTKWLIRFTLGPGRENKYIDDLNSRDVIDFLVPLNRLLSRYTSNNTESFLLEVIQMLGDKVSLSEVQPHLC